jgi:hypothetical protein
LLRDRAWIDANGIRVGETIDLRMTELEVNADAVVVSIAAGPEVLPGDGPVVTGRFVTRQASDLVRVTFAGGVQLVGTHSHPIWSPLHQDWRALGEFEPGDLVQTRTGLLAVQAIEPLAIRPAVYNIEVAGEHVYEVTELGVLVHNNNPLCEELTRLRAARDSGEQYNPDRLRELESLLGARVTGVPRSVDELLVNGTVPGTANGAFEAWINGMSEAEVLALRADPRLIGRQTIWRKIGDRLRDGAGNHEWLMVAELPTFRRWNVSVSEIQRFVTRTSELDVIHPVTHAAANHLRGPSSVMSAFHTELRELIQSSLSLADLNISLPGFMDRWSVPVSVRPTLPVTSLN